MPVAVPPLVNRSANNNTRSAADNGFITREYPVSDFVTEESSMVEDDYGEEDEDEDYSSSDSEEAEQALLNFPVTHRPSELFAEYFDYEPTVINRERTCNHQATSRPCPYCLPNVSMRLANEVRIAFRALFNPKLMKFNYVPLDRNIVESPFKALKALHDLIYIKKILNEIINFIVTIQNLPDYKINYAFSSALLRIHDRTESLLDDIKGSGKHEEYQIVQDFRMKLNAIGLVHGSSCKENNSYQPLNMVVDYQR
jgi:hypothetical protein